MLKYVKTNFTWDKALPVALLWIRVDSRSKLKLSPFEILCGRLFQVSTQAGESSDVLKGPTTANYVKIIATIPTSVYKCASNRSAYPPEVPLDPIQPKDLILLKSWKEQGHDHQLAVQWTGWGHMTSC